MIPTSTLATYEAARNSLMPVFEKLRKETPGKELSDLVRWTEMLSGWLPTIGEIAAEAGGEARNAKVKAENTRADLYAAGLVANQKQREAEAMARADSAVQKGLAEWAEMKGWADKFYTLRDDCLESLNGIKKAIEAAKIERGLG